MVACFSRPMRPGFFIVPDISRSIAMKHLKEQKKNLRVVTFLNREEVDYLDKLGKDALFSNGMKISRAKLIAWLIEFTRKLDLNVENVRSEKDFEHRLLEVVGHHQSHQPR
jgi:hypothetical protein